MNHFPIYLNLAGRKVVLVGSGECALAKLRLLARTTAQFHLFAPDIAPALETAARDAKAVIHDRLPDAADLADAALVYAAQDDAALDARTEALARSAGVLLNVVDNLQASDFITPALVDRDPVTVAIGTEGAAPVLARAIKADLEARLPASLGALTRAGQAFRPQAETLPKGRARRDFWSDYYLQTGPQALQRGHDLTESLQAQLERHLEAAPRAGRVDLVGAGPGDPELLTLRARNLLDAADVVIHDGLVPPAILELARREAVLIAVGKTGYGPSTPQATINALMVEHAASGAQVVRLKAGDATVFARLDEEIEALDSAGIDWAVVPGITAASAAAAVLGTSLTRRGRNSDLRILTGHDVAGFADHDWRALAQPDVVAAIYMGKRAARFLQGRLIMHGADPATPVTAVENASRPDQVVLASRLDRLAGDLASLDGPVVLMLGLAPRQAVAALKESA